MEIQLKTHIFILIIFFTTSIYASSNITSQEIALRIQNSIESKLKGPNKNIIKTIYEKNSYNPIWVGTVNKTKLGQLITALNNPLFNYKDKPMGRTNIKKLFFLLDNNEISNDKKKEVYARLDMMLSNSFVALVRFIVQGDVDWVLLRKKMVALKESNDIEAKWEITPKDLPPIESLYTAMLNNNIKNYLKSLITMESRYYSLVKLLKDYRAMEKFPKVVYTNDIFKLGDKDARLVDIKKRLLISGDLEQDAPLDKYFDAKLKKAVIKYQTRYHLKVDGNIDKVMTYYLNQPVKKNIQQIIANLDKCKLYPKSFEDEYIEVNIPDFNLRYYSKGEKLFKSGVVVGRIDRPTPIFSDMMTHMVLNPTWTIPDNLIKRDLIPTLREDPKYMEDNNIHVFSGQKEIQLTEGQLDQYENSTKAVPYRFVQYPGDNNALGRIKFMFPNKYAVYLHDTDNKTLLERRYKIYSSGCMRVDKPFNLMRVLLEHTKEEYNQEKIDEILESMKTTTIKLTQPIPVHILYFTVYKEDGLAYFKNDIYLYDQMIWESSAGQKKSTFKIPKKRFIDVKKNAKTKQELHEIEKNEKPKRVNIKKQTQNVSNDAIEMF